MGYTPLLTVRTGPPPDRESFHLGRAKAAYVRGDVTIERFEECVAHVLAGGHLPEVIYERGELPWPTTPPPRPRRPMVPDYRL